MSGVPPTAILRKAARLKQSRAINMKALSFVTWLNDPKTNHEPPQGSGAPNSGPWLFNTSQTHGTPITDERMYRRLALAEGDPDHPLIHGCGPDLCGPECRAPPLWGADEIDAAMRDLHMVVRKTRPGGGTYLGCSCLGFWHVRMCSHSLLVQDMTGDYTTASVRVHMCPNVLKCTLLRI